MSFRYWATTLCFALSLTFGTSVAESREIRAFVVRPDLVGLRLTLGRVSEGGLQAYEPAQTDRIDPKWQTIRRRNIEYGTLIAGSGGEELVAKFDRFEPDILQAMIDRGDVDDPVTYHVLTDGELQSVSAVWRKSKIVQTAQTGRFERTFVMQHDLVLALAKPLTSGAQVRIEMMASEPVAVDFNFNEGALLSEALHVSQIGFRPTDPVKVAYLSYWLGDQARQPGSDGAVEYILPLSFELREAAGGETVFSGQVSLDKSKDTPSNHSLNFNGTDVYALDFSEFQTPGRYFVSIDGIGRSLEFEIGEQVWANAFRAAMRGLFHQRSGLALTAPFTDWSRPRNLHPDDGLLIRQSTAQLMDSSMGLNLKQQDSFEALARGATDEIVNQAWGGWQDAGDWDRRVQHLRVVRDLLELTYYRPEFAQSLRLPIPERDNALADIVDEALWGLDVFRRLQKSDGGIPGGIESAGHPRFGEPSWLESQSVYVYAPDPWSSFEYAATAARAALVVADYDSVRAADYAASAKAAMLWGEAHLPDYARLDPVVNTARNLAAAELYRLSQAAHWHRLFLATSAYDGRKIAWNERQFEAVLVYTDTALRGQETDGAVLTLGQRDLLDFAQFLITKGDRGAFGQIHNPNTPFGYGYTSAVPADAAQVLIKTYLLEPERDLLAAIFDETQFGLGANPDNLVFTTGLGERPITQALVVDGLAMGRMPTGITIFGLWNVADRGGHRAFSDIDAVSFPAMSRAVPVHESFNADIRAVPLMEFSAHATLGPTAYVWGFLAATAGESD